MFLVNGGDITSYEAVREGAVQNIFVDGFRERIDPRNNNSIVTVDFSVRNVSEIKEGILLMKLVTQSCDSFSGTTYPPSGSSFYANLQAWINSYLMTYGKYTYSPMTYPVLGTGYSSITLGDDMCSRAPDARLPPMRHQ